MVLPTIPSVVDSGKTTVKKKSGDIAKKAKKRSGIYSRPGNEDRLYGDNTIKRS